MFLESTVAVGAAPLGLTNDCSLDSKQTSAIFEIQACLTKPCLDGTISGKSGPRREISCSELALKSDWPTVGEPDGPLPEGRPERVMDVVAQ